MSRFVRFVLFVVVNLHSIWLPRPTLHRLAIRSRATLEQRQDSTTNNANLTNKDRSLNYRVIVFSISFGSFLIARDKQRQGKDPRDTGPWF